MSAYFFALNRSGKPFSETIAKRMSDQLERFAQDGSRLVVQENFAMSYQRHWTVPEEVGEEQPLFNQDNSLWLLFHGRIDNRPDLLAKIDISSKKSLSGESQGELSDAALLMELYQQHGKQILKEIIGPFAFVFFDQKNESVLAARDAMGGRYLVYRVTSDTILIATYEMGLVAHPDVGYKINQQKAGRLLANIMDMQPASLIEGLKPLLAGHCLKISKTGYEISQFYLPDAKKRTRLPTNSDYALEFRRLLDQAIKRRLRSVKPVGVMLSGGLDSLPLAISATIQLDSDNARLKAFSWVFDKFPDADERQYFSPVCESFGICSYLINCDSIWPQFDQSTHTNPIVPFSTPYSSFTQALMASAQNSGTGVLLSGMGGDMLYSGVQPLLLELLKEGRVGAFFTEFRGLFNASQSARSFLKSLLINPLFKRYKVQQNPPHWLRAELVDATKTKPYLHKAMQGALRPLQYFNVVGSLEGEDAAYGRYLDAPYGIERRYPFRDRDLAEFMLSIPSDQLFFQLTPRPIVRKAFESELPKIVLQRKDKTNFNQVIEAGIERDLKYQEWLFAPSQEWSKYVNKGQILSEDPSHAANLGLKWRCAYYEYWKTVCYTSHAQKLG